MKINFPEITKNQFAKEAIKAFPDIDFIPSDSLENATRLLQTGGADSLISGIDYPSRDVVLACKDYLPLKTKYFSSCFICEKENQTFALADGGINKNPTKEQLLTVIEDTTKTFLKYTNQQPRIALLSYSTYGSGGKNPDLEKYQFCLEQIKTHHPDWIIDGEMQLDAALNPRVSAKKTPNSPLKGKANILIVPDLNSGNILYKSLELFGGFTIAGPLIQGFRVPLADLSRGSTTEDIILTIKVLRSLL